MTDDDWRVRFERRRAFAKTELGRLYLAHESALVDYWRHDADERISHNKLTMLDNRCHEATEAFVARLMELAGV